MEPEIVTDKRDRLGRRVREVWIEWARRQPSPKVSWLIPYDELSESDKEADRCIGAAIWGDAVNEFTEFIAGGMLARSPQPIPLPKLEGGGIDQLRRENAELKADSSHAIKLAQSIESQWPGIKASLALADELAKAVEAYQKHVGSTGYRNAMFAALAAYQSAPQPTPTQEKNQ